jgi:hypothetical protein
MKDDKDFYLDNLRTICPEYKYNTKFNKNIKNNKNNISSLEILFKIETFENFRFFNKIKFVILSQNIN